MTSTLDQRINASVPQPGNPPLWRRQGVGHPCGPSGSEKAGAVDGLVVDRHPALA